MQTLFCTCHVSCNATTTIPASLVMSAMASLHTFEVASHHGNPPLSHCSKNDAFYHLNTRPYCGSNRLMSSLPQLLRYVTRGCVVILRCSGYTTPFTVLRVVATPTCCALESVKTTSLQVIWVFYHCMCRHHFPSQQTSCFKMVTWHNRCHSAMPRPRTSAQT